MGIEVMALAGRERGAIEAPLEFDVFCGRSYARVVRGVALYCGDEVLAEDVTQEAFARAFVRWSKVQGMESAEAWVLRVAMNEATSWFRRVGTARRHMASKTAGEARTDPSDALAVRAALAKLTDRQRQAVVLRYLIDLPVRETAAAMRCAEGTVRALTSQGLSTLRAELAEEIEEPIDG